MLLFNESPFRPLKMCPAGDDGGGGGGSTGNPGGEGGDSGGDNNPGPGGEGGNSPDGDGQGGDDGGNNDLPEDESQWTPEQTKSYIKKLRKENQSYRSRFQKAEAKTAGLEERFGKLESGLKNLVGGDDDEETPEDKIARLEESQAVSEMNQAVVTTAYALGVPADGLDYFKFLIQQQAEQMEDDDVIGEDVLAELAQKAKAHANGSSKGATTSADGQGGQPPKPEGKRSGVKAAEFAKMTIAERSALYQRNKDEYAQLMQECKEQKLLFT